MSLSNGLAIKEPTPLLLKSLKIDFKDFMKSLTKIGVDITFSKWDLLIKDGADALSALGLKVEPEETAWILIYRSLVNSMQALVSEIEISDNNNFDYKELSLSLTESFSNEKLVIDSEFFRKPENSLFVNIAKSIFINWLISSGLKDAEAISIGNRLPIYFTAELHGEWGRNIKVYGVIKNILDTPFTKANSRVQAWSYYSSWLRKQVDEPMFMEAFSLNQIYISPRAYIKNKITQKIINYSSETEVIKETKTVICLDEELISWIERKDKNDAIRLISGGPGSGKSSFVKIFTATVIDKLNIPVLFIPLHQFELSNDLIDAVGKFIRDDGFLDFNPLGLESIEERLLIVFDGLDELSMQGEVSEKIAQDFIREIIRKVDRLNQNKMELQVLISGREVVIQANENEFKKYGQVLHLLPYYIEEDENNEYIDNKDLLSIDQREIWWSNYGKLNGKCYDNIPEELLDGNMDDITSQPLLNYLVAYSYHHGMLNLKDNMNLNLIYSDLLSSIYQRGWAGYQHSSIKYIEDKDFYRILEEVALASWHGDGRTTTVREIEKHCNNSGLKNLLSKFESGLINDPKTNITGLLTAFYFRQTGYKGNDRTFEFTHKSFGEYLTARRIIREIILISKKLNDRENDPDDGWDERDALFRWSLLCGKTLIDEYLASFVSNEIEIYYNKNKNEVLNWQRIISYLIEFMLVHGIPMERFEPRPKFNEENIIACNSEDALLILLSLISHQTKEVSEIKWTEMNTFGSFLLRVKGQREYFSDNHHKRFVNILSYLNLNECSLVNSDLWQYKVNGANMNYIRFVGADLRGCTFDKTLLTNSSFACAIIDGGRFLNSDLTSSNFDHSSVNQGIFRHSELINVSFCNANLIGAKFLDVDLTDVNFKGAILTGVNFKDANLTGANFKDANLTGANLTGANLTGVNFKNANLTDVDFKDANLTDVNFKDANLIGTYL